MKLPGTYYFHRKMAGYIRSLSSALILTVLFMMLLNVQLFAQFKTGESGYATKAELSEEGFLPSQEAFIFTVEATSTRTVKKNVIPKHMILGTVGGGLIGSLIGIATYKECTDTGFMSCFMAPESRSESGMMGAAAGGTLGFIIGTISGVITTINN